MNGSDVSAGRLVSVIVPCYNQARFLGEALDSVLSQRYAPIETIVVDDGSSDRTSEVARRFTGVRLLRQRNSGTAAARNLGWRASRGDYLLFLDSDDRLLPGAVESGVEAHEREPGLGLVWGAVRVIDSDGCPLREPDPGPAPADDAYLALLRHNFIWTPGTVLYRRAAVESAGGFRAAAGGSADVDLNLRVGAAWPIRGHGRRVLEYRDHGGSQSEDAALMLRSAVSVRRRHRRFVRGRPESEKALAAGISEAQAYYGKRLFAQASFELRRLRLARAARWFAVLCLYGMPRPFAFLGRRER